MTSLRCADEQSTSDKESEFADLYDVFEIVDYSTATDWERITSEIEKTFRAWKLCRLKCTPVEAHQVCESEPMNITLAGRNYRISLKTIARTQPRAISTELLRHLDSSFHVLIEGDAPGVLRWALSTNFDFDSKVHVIQSRIGIPEFVVLEPAQGDISDKISVSESKMLLSALVTAATALGMDVPVFTQVFEAKVKQYFGHCAGLGWTTTYDGAQLPYVPKSYAHIQGLLTLFHSKLAHLPVSIKAYVSVKFTYSFRNWMLDWARSQHETAESKVNGNLYHDRLILPLGALGESLEEDVLLDDNVHTELTPYTAPSWWLSVERRASTPLCKLEKMLRNFMELCHTTETFRELLGSNAYIDTEEENPALGRNALRMLTKQPASAFSEDIVQAGRNLRVKFDSVVQQTVRHVRTGRENGQLLSNQDIDDILGHMFIHVDDWDQDNSENLLMDPCKTAPKRGLLYCLAIYLACVDIYSGGLVSVATLWNEFVMEIRWHWEKLKPIPRLSTSQTEPNFNSCLLQQKLELINCCIYRKQNSDGENVIQSSTKNTSSSTDDTDDTDDDDEFFICPENEQGMMERLERMKQQASLNPDSYAMREDKNIEPMGVHKVHSSLKLLNGEVLRIPLLQQPGPLTEDMLSRHLSEMINLGDSVEGTAMRAEIYVCWNNKASLSLRSDMEAFKAANPGCELADFIRWHSPKDWVFNESIGESELSQRMRHPDNLWQSLWKEARPVAASQQRTLFDATAEVGRALNYMEELKMADLARQLFPCLLEEIYTRLKDELHAEECPKCLITEHCSMKHLSSHLGEDIGQDHDRYEEIIERFAHLEHEMAVYSSLIHLLGPKQKELCDHLIVDSTCLVLQEQHRKAVLDLFSSSTNESHLPKPERREYIFRAAFEQGAHRMYASLREDSFDITGAFSTAQY
eukprot:gene3966-6424_t